MAGSAPRRRFRGTTALAAAILGAWMGTALLPLPSARAAIPVPPSALARGALLRGQHHVETRLLADASTVSPGDEFRVGVLFTLAPGWHVYWRNPGQSGIATEVKLEGEFLEIGALRWPAPEIFRQGGDFIETYGYSREVLLFATARVAPSALGRIALTARLDFLVCKIDCIPARATLRRTLEVGPAAHAAGPAPLALFNRSQARTPRRPEAVGLRLEAAYSQTPIRPEDSFRLALGISCTPSPKACAGARLPTTGPRDAFVPDQLRALTLRPTGSVPHPRDPRGLVLLLGGRAGPDLEASPGRLTGVLRLRDGQGHPLPLAVDVPLPRGLRGAAVVAVSSPLLAGTSAPSGGAAGAPVIPLWEALLLAFLGGLILNVMPCVFPVLAIKVHGFVATAQAEQASVRSHALAYTVGIVASMLALGAVVVGLRASGTVVSWGMQLQEPLFVAILAAVLMAFALNLFGVWEIGVRAGAVGRAAARTHGLARSFWEGVLAVVLATPCSAPFLGTAVGFAFASEAPVTLAVFATIGLGLAAPFVLLVQFRRLARLLPRPGPWMERLRQVLGFALLGTMIWLVWVFGRLTDVDEVGRLLVLLGAVAFAAWLFGLAQHRSARGRALAAVVAAALVGGAGYGTLGPRSPDSIAWQPFQERRVQQVVQEGRPAFVDFTADWCTTCKWNKWAAIDREAVRQEISRHGVAMFRADFTKRDPTIARVLSRFGRSSVPLYLVYRARRPEGPRVLPELLTTDLVVEALREAATP